MWKISDVLGLPPDHMISNAGPKSKVKPLFKMENGQHHLSVKGHVLKGPTKNFRAMVRRPTAPPYTMEQECMYSMFEDLVLKMLEYDPAKRTTPTEALKHAFVSTDTPLRPNQTAASGRGDGSSKVDQGSQT